MGCTLTSYFHWDMCAGFYLYISGLTTGCETCFWRLDDDGKGSDRWKFDGWNEIDRKGELLHWKIEMMENMLIHQINNSYNSCIAVTWK